MASCSTAYLRLLDLQVVLLLELVADIDLVSFGSHHLELPLLILPLLLRT
jgi:hypothetical protein